MLSTIHYHHYSWIIQAMKNELKRTQKESINPSSHVCGPIQNIHEVTEFAEVPVHKELYNSDGKNV